MAQTSQYDEDVVVALLDVLESTGWTEVRRIHADMRNIGDLAHDIEHAFAG